MKLPKIPISGQAVSPDWGREVVDCLRSLRPSSGPNMRVTQTPEGTSYSAGSTSSSSASVRTESATVIAKVTSVDDAFGIGITCYPNYPSTSGSYSGILAIMETALDPKVPVDTYVIAHTFAVTLSGGA